MNNSMQRIAELEAEVASLKAERDALKEKNGQTDIQTIADLIEARLNRVERNLREDFVGKFAGILLPATESITNRVVTLEKRELQLEKQLKKVETGFENHINAVSTNLNEAGTKQQDFLTALDALITRYREEQESTVNTQKSILQANYNIAKAVNDAANHCTKFADDYEEVSTKAKSRINEYTIEMKSSLKAYMNEIKYATDEAVNPLLRRVKFFTDSQLKRKLIVFYLGVILTLLFSSGFAWLTQPQRLVERDAQKWRTFISDLTPIQAEKVNKLLSEIEKEKKEAENNLDK